MSETDLEGMQCLTWNKVIKFVEFFAVKWISNKRMSNVS